MTNGWEEYDKELVLRLMIRSGTVAESLDAFAALRYRSIQLDEYDFQENSG
jgi:hypothetical protein